MANDVGVDGAVKVGTGPVRSTVRLGAEYSVPGAVFPYESDIEPAGSFRITVPSEQPETMTEADDVTAPDTVAIHPVAVPPKVKSLDSRPVGALEKLNAYDTEVAFVGLVAGE
ncbi:MAG: hypothetical protein EBX99_09170 [Acidimicrobiia bacterium]|nr:hypothetical protein [Acidimicrobiia bacterium]